MKMGTLPILLKKKLWSEYCEQLNANKLDNLDEIDKFQEIQNLPRQSHKEIENLNRPVTSKDIESIVKTLPNKAVDQ